MIDVAILLGVLALSLSIAVAWKRREGRVVAVEDSLEDGVRERVGVRADQPVLLLFTTPTCANCDEARGVLTRVVQQRSDIAVAEVDVASEPAVARAHRVMRAPTVLVVDHDNAIRARVGGVPDPTALAEALPR